MNDKPKRLTNYKVFQVAGDVPCDPRAVRKVLEGKPVRESLAERIRDALSKRGYAPTP